MGVRRLIVLTAAVAVAALVLVVIVVTGRTPAPAGAAPSTALSSYARAPGATTLAGTGVPGFAGDGGAADGARLDAPVGVAEDSSGDLFIADAGNCRVREVPAASGVSFGHRVQAGHIVTIAGGPCGSSSANPAPSALGVDSGGNLFIPFGAGARVEELPAHNGTSFGRTMTAGKLTTVAGTSSQGFGGDGGSATKSELDDPTGVTVDHSGDLFIADTGNCRLRMVAGSSGTRFGAAVIAGDIYTVAGTGICGSNGDGGPATDAQLWDPGALAVDGAGDVLVADQGNRTIRVLTTHTGSIYGVALAADDLGTVAGEGSYGPYLVDGLSAVGETSELNFPTGLAVAADGTLYIADGSMQVIRMVPAATTTLLGKPAKTDDIYTVAGAYSIEILHNKTERIQTRMLDPTGLALAPGGQLVYSDGLADVVRQLPANS
jgi:hypothetical protein